MTKICQKMGGLECTGGSNYYHIITIIIKKNVQVVGTQWASKPISNLQIYCVVFLRMVFHASLNFSLKVLIESAATTSFGNLFHVGMVL